MSRHIKRRGVIRLISSEHNAKRTKLVIELNLTKTTQPLSVIGAVRRLMTLHNATAP